MDIKKIEKVIKLVKANDVKKFKYKDADNEIELDFTNGASQQYSQQLSQDIQQDNIKSYDEKQEAISNDQQEIKSPMVGTFFLQDSKELTEPKIKVGDTVTEGDVIGYIEAMKVMNEVTTDVSGEVTEILVEHGDNVEYDQLLVRVK
ncbi:acetyl-CoA carboxylase biotin carboxyl carrier protein subunit [Staphylococcus epidermidis]|nr:MULTISPECIES: biotin/lipoyl-containing protein [Staphylococcus]MBF2190451.1 acetyl-CoA carboxylase biotin carboxyl carrier protein subunit [Staphylococcus epidermidis]MBM6370330.1 acetyl-CoA carboxylase biotin carboxyl carrier protein subunit [Staphylococcus epidermidis]MCF7581979.1 acetyl-CoA carboxylase biotin carboxyl carrier protein subunit [Staphylococcus epidermidis]MCG1176633.1 acetyl-CoA carboxylase biotin carboxyl carrier protein subunit [Staphylococcus epidermidis]MCG1272502.1 ace